MTTIDTTVDQVEPIVDENELIAQRKQKLHEWRLQGKAYPNTFKRKNLAGDLHIDYDEFNHDDLEAKHVHVAVAGRIRLAD